jgi:hypothetical protein
VQYTYEPYGALQLAESFTQHPVNRLGHQGLFFERFDAGPYDPALVPGARGLCHARNRWYDPVTGRWTTRDPNETALPIAMAGAMNGTLLDVYLGGFSVQGQYGDGLNLLQYERSNPVSGLDPLGLFDWFDDVDDTIASMQAEKVAWASMYYELGVGLYKGAAMAAVETLVYAYGGMPGRLLVSGYGAYTSGNDILEDGLNFWNGFAFVGSVLGGAGDLARIMGRFTGTFGRAVARLRELRICGNSFVGGTLVDTPDGPAPIECMGPGVFVLTRDQQEPSQRECGAPVTRVSKRLAPIVLWVTLATGQVVGMTPGHEVWTHQDGWTYGSHIQVGDTLLARGGEAMEIVAIDLDRTPTEVYDLEVDGTFTYFVDGLWVHNNVCRLTQFSKYKTFTRGHFRHNLSVKTAFDPGPSFDAHHVFPDALESRFQGRINIHDPKYGAWWDAHANRSNWSTYNNEWREFFRINPNASAQQILEKGRQMATHYGFQVNY